MEADPDRHPVRLALMGRRFLWSAALVVAAFGSMGRAEVSASQDHPPTRQVPQEYWDTAKASFKQGAYRDALQGFEMILAINPDDPWAQLYRSTCERRLQSSSPFHSVSRAQLDSLNEQLRQEERTRKQLAAKQKAIERQIRLEQAAWDRELDTLIRQAQQEQGRTRRIAQEEAVSRQRAERTQATAVAQEAAVAQARAAEAPPASSTPAPAHPPELPPAPPSPQPPQPSTESVAPTLVQPPAEPPPREAEPTPVPMVKSVEEKASPRPPELAKRPLPPPGAVQINAKQMSVSPERKIAIAEGDVEVLTDQSLLRADHVTLFTDTHDVYAEGHVWLADGAQVFRGEMVHYNLKTKKGRFLQGTIASPPWYEHGRSVEHIAEGVYRVTPGYITSCDQEPPHFKFLGRSATVFAEDKIARVRNVALVVEKVPFLYFPWLSVADRHMPFFIIPGKKKPWEQFVLMGYRYEWPEGQKGTIHLDWRRAFGWGTGLDHQFESERFGAGLFKVYYNDEPNIRRPKLELPKGAEINRYRVLWRHNWHPLPDTTVLTNIQKYSDIDFRRELLFREEFVEEESPDSFISSVTNAGEYTLSTLIRKRVNRFQTVDEAFPELTFDVNSKRIGDTELFAESSFDVANFQTKRAHSDNDTDVVRVDWFQQLKYGLNLFRPILVTPRVGVRQTFYNKDKQGGIERPDGKRDLISGQFSMGADASLKLFRIFPVTTNLLGLDINWLRHVVTPTVGYTYIHPPTVPNEILNFAQASGPTSQCSFGFEQKWQTKRKVAGKRNPKSVDLARGLVSLPYTFRGNGNKQGGRLGDWAFDIELYPWPWMRFETDWSYPSHFVRGSRDAPLTAWNMDLVIVGGKGEVKVQDAPEIQAPKREVFQAGPKGELVELLMPAGQWYLGLGHRYSQNDKTEDVLQFDWRFSKKWELSTLHRFTWKEVANGSKRFNNLREVQYILRRDLHDWIAEAVYRVDREFGEELFFTLTLKAYPRIPIELEDSYHQPKIGSQSSPFSPLASPR